MGKINEKIEDLKSDSETAFASSQLKDEQNQLSNLEDTYVKLASRTDLTADEKKKLADTTAQLKDLVPGLIDVTNGDTDAIDKNKQMIDEKIVSLSAEGNYIALVAQVGQAKAKSMIQNEINQTETTIKNAQGRIDAYKAEMTVLKGLITFIEKIPVIGDKVKNSTLGKDLTDYNYNVDLLNQSEKKLKALKSEAASENQGDIDWNKYMTQYNKASDAVKNNTNAQNDNTKSTQDGTDAANDNSDALENNTKKIEDNTATMDRAKEVAKEYELQLSSLANVIKKQENITENYAKGSEKRRTSMQQEIELVKQEIGIYQDAQASASSVTSMRSIVANQSGTAIGKQIVTDAEKYLGTPYVWGGESPQGFDCSGLVQYVYKQVGVELSRTTYDQYKQGTPVSKQDLEPGDLVFFKGSDGSWSSPGHVGIYAGDGKYIQAPKTGDVVKISDLDARNDYIGARRIVSGNGSNTSVTSSKLTYADIVNAAAQKYGLSPNLIAGVIQEESGWDASVISPAGAKGLMQLMPGTASEWGVADVYNPYQNIMGGTAYLAYLVKKYGERQGVALYNTGEYGGGSQSYANAVLNYASQFANDKLEMPTTSVSGTLSDEQDMMLKVEEYASKIEDDTQKIHELYKDIYEDWITQYDNQTKLIDSSIQKMESMKDIDGENDNAYIANLKQILDTTNSKIAILKNEQNFVNSQLKNPGGVYTDAVLQEMQEKSTELVNTITDVQKAIKEAGYAWAQSKFDNITTTIQTNLTLIENALNRLDNAKTVDLSSKLSLQTQKVDEDKKYIQSLTDLLRELNAEEAKTGAVYLFDKIKEINAELDKAKTTLSEDNKGIEDIKNSISDLTSTILDKIKEIISKNNELFKDGLDKNLKLFEDAVDKEVNKLEEARKKLENNETNYTDIQNINDLQRQLNAIQGDDIASKAQREDLQKQLDEANRQFASDTMDQNIQNREDALNKAKDEYEKLEQSYADAIDNSNDDANLNKQANQALIGGYLLDSNGNKVDLETALKNYEDEFGEGLTVLGNKIKTELIDQLKEVQDLMNEFGTLDTTKINSTSKVRTVYGTGVDLQNAESILGTEGYNYVDTSWTSADQVNPQSGDIVLSGSVPNNKINGATNLTGRDRYQTALFLQMFKDSVNGTIPYISEYNNQTMSDYIKQFGIMSQSGRVFGTGTDLENAKKLLGKFGYTFIDTNDISGIDLNENDIVVGGPGVIKGSENVLPSGARWLWGNNREDTLVAIQKLLDEFDRFPVDIEGFAEGGDVDFTGMAMLHGSKSKPETVINYDQGQGLHSFLMQLPDVVNKQLKENSIGLSNSPMVQGYYDTMSKIKSIMDNNTKGSNNNTTPVVQRKYVIQIDKVYGTDKDTAEEFARDALNYINKQG